MTLLDTLPGDSAKNRCIVPEKRSSAIGAAYLGLQSLMLLSYDAFAVAPNVDNWQVANGDITAPCPVEAISCQFTTVDNGFLMRKVIMPPSSPSNPNQNYWQFIMTDPNATGEPVNDPFAPTGLSFSNESIIRADNAPNGTLGLGAQTQKTLIAESILDASTNIEDRWSQVSYVRTGLGWGVSFEARLAQIDWSAGPDNPEVLFDSMHKAQGNLGYFGGVREFTQVMTQDIWQGADMTQKFQYQIDPVPRLHTAGTGTPILPGGSNGGDLTTGTRTNRRVLAATYVGQSVANNTATPSLFSYTGFTSFKSRRRETTATSTELSSLTSANPAVNLNRFFTFDSLSTYGPTSLLPSNIFNINPNINAPAPIVTATAWASGPPVDAAVTALNDHVASPLSGGTGSGGPPIDLGGWTVENGAIILDPCPNTVVCGPVTVGDGFVQREVLVIADGSTYYQTIVTAAGATGDTAIAPQLSATALAGETIPVVPSVPRASLVPPPPSDPFVAGALPFASETFVKRGGSGGIASRTQVLGETRKKITIHGTAGIPLASRGNVYAYQYPQVEGMAQRITLNTGWAQGTGAAPVVDIKQIIGIDDSTTANYSQNSWTPGIFLGWDAGSQFDYTMAANGASDYTVVSIPSQNKPTGLYMRKISGGVQTSSHALSDPLLISGGTNGGNIAWSPGDTIQALWWGDSYNFYTGRVRNGFTAYTNLTTGDRTSRTQALSMPNGGPATSNQFGRYVSANPPTPWVSPFDTPAPPAMSTYGNGIVWVDQPLW